MEKKFIEVEISKLKDYEKNNKIHTTYNIDEIVKSIQKCEYLSPILVDENFEIINWHWRKQALEKLWYKKIQVLQVSWLSDIQKKSARLLDNKVWTLSQFNIENLKIELEEIWDIEISNLFDDLVMEAIDYEEIYKWMPEYNQQDLTADYQIKVSFKNVEDIQEFGKLIWQALTEKTRSIWFPASVKALDKDIIIDEE